MKPTSETIWAEDGMTLGSGTLLYIPLAAVIAWIKRWPCEELRGPVIAHFDAHGNLTDHNQGVVVTSAEFDAITTDALSLLYEKHPAMRGQPDETSRAALRPYLP